MTQKALRNLARAVLAEHFDGKNKETTLAHIAIQVLHAPQHKGE